MTDEKKALLWEFSLLCNSLKAVNWPANQCLIAIINEKKKKLRLPLSKRSQVEKKNDNFKIGNFHNELDLQ